MKGDALPSFDTLDERTLKTSPYFFREKMEENTYEGSPPVGRESEAKSPEAGNDEPGQREPGRGEQRDQEKDQEAGGNEDDESESFRDPSRGKEKLRVRGKKPTLHEGRNGRFEGRAEICLPDSVTQVLTMLFDLEILPRYYASYAECGISLDNVVIAASTLVDGKDPERQLSHLFTAEKIRIIVGASGSEYASQPAPVSPRPRDFVNKTIHGTEMQVWAGVEASIVPKGTLKAGYKRSLEKEEPPIASEVRLLFTGTGRPTEHAWVYAPYSLSTATRTELSRTNPPMHSAVFESLLTNFLRRISG